MGWSTTQQQTTTTQDNDLVKRFAGTVKVMLRLARGEKPITSWDEKLNRVVFAYNTTLEETMWETLLHDARVSTWHQRDEKKRNGSPCLLQIRYRQSQRKLIIVKQHQRSKLT